MGTTGTTGTLGTPGTTGTRSSLPVTNALVPVVPVPPTLTTSDWRGLPAADVTPLLTAEADLYRRHLHWDVSEAWRPIEPARIAGALPGYVVRDESGEVRGWTCFLDHTGLRQVAMLVADSPAVTAELVERVVTAPGAAGTRGEIVCVRDAAPSLADVLRARQFDVAVYRYLAFEWSGRSLERPTAKAQFARTWSPADLEPVVALSMRAYEDSTDVRAFAPAGTPEEWLDYITTLVSGTGCGTFMPDSSFLVPDDDPGTLDAAVLTTDLGFGTAHIAQLIVDPAARGRGLGRRLVETALQSAQAHGSARVTLLVADTNRSAGRLYDAAGFVDRGQYIVAARLRG